MTPADIRTANLCVVALALLVCLWGARASADEPTAHMADSMIRWIAANSEYRAKPRPPVAFISRADIGHLFYQNRKISHDVLAFYHLQARVLFLRRTWDARKLHDRSALLHELVHHLQNPADFACTNAMEHDAYLLQDKWLREHGSTLEKENGGTDLFTIYVNSACAQL